jgi:hypothetical protein
VKVQHLRCVLLMRFCVVFRDLGLEEEQILLHDTRSQYITNWHAPDYTGEFVSASGISELFGTEVLEGLTNYSVCVYIYI